MKNTKLYITLFFFGIYGNSFGQEAETIPPLITDRPDATESPSTVQPGWLQVETGAFFTSFEANGAKEQVNGLNTTLLRFGLLDNLELRLGWNFEEGITKVGEDKLDDIASGFSPLLAGLKVNITEEKGLLPEIGLIGHVFLPFTASTDYRPETTGVDFRLSLAHTLNENSSIAYNIGAQWGNDSPEAAYIYTLAYGYSITEKFGAYAELYGDFPEDSKANHFWDAGLTYLIAHNIQLDATIGRSITEGQDILISGGVSFRIPK